MQIIAKKVEVGVSRIYKTAKEMLPKIPRKIILLTYGAFSPREMVLKLLGRMKLTETNISLCKTSKRKRTFAALFLTAVGFP